MSKTKNSAVCGLIVHLQLDAKATEDLALEILWRLRSAPSSQTGWTRGEKMKKVRKLTDFRNYAFEEDTDGESAVFTAQEDYNNLFKNLVLLMQDADETTLVASPKYVQVDDDVVAVEMKGLLTFTPDRAAAIWKEVLPYIQRMEEVEREREAKRAEEKRQRGERSAAIRAKYIAWDIENAKKLLLENGYTVNTNMALAPKGKASFREGPG